MSHIFSVSRKGTITEYDSLDYAVTANEFAIFKFSQTDGIKRYQFFNGEDFDSTFAFEKWLMRVTYLDRYGEISYDIVDRNGVVKHFNTSRKYHQAVAECVEKFAATTAFIDFKEIELQQREQEHIIQQTSLQKQLDELRSEIQLLKRKIEESTQKLS